MRKINSIGYGHKILGVAALFLIAIPFCCYLLYLFFHRDTFIITIYLSFGIGLIINLCFAVLLAIEFRQDKAIGKKYETLKKMKLSIGNGIYECQSCGNRQVERTSIECGVCGMVFYQERGKKT